ncbi:chorismate-binding protein [Anditalea andensis]|uniref:Isochorismate synthase n=1 Tax=Anditalea andensis TaxID=1048983 RepID=A0A074KX93_9BACT|nr:chorismate-binding protein [Anditalea andensis]KEO74586.1 isochorismate synthase [Anditalea andensis]
MSSATSEKVITQEQYLNAVFNYVLEHGFSLAVWRKPKSDQLEVIIDTNKDIKKLPLQLDKLPPGFVIHPFADQSDKKCYFLEAHTYLKIPLDGTIDEDGFFKKANKSATKESIDKLLRERSGKTGNQIDISSQTSFLNEVKEGIRLIKNGELIKVVPARNKYLQLKVPLNISGIILSLCSSYPNAFVNFIHSAHIGTWIGASPEILIKTEGSTFSTMALAGTQKAIGANPLKNAAWTQKEIEEQALVSRYIVNCFKKIRLREYEERGPKTVIAGNLLHLRSDFIVDMEATGFPQLGSVMLDLLHPTSAVCGMPRDKALEFISDHETFDRSLYAGFIGPVNIGNESSLYVNLRTARITDQYAILYAGAGVTEDSDPEKEWEETEMKCDIIGKFLTDPILN